MSSRGILMFKFSMRRWHSSSVKWPFWFLSACLNCFVKYNSYSFCCPRLLMVPTKWFKHSIQMSLSDSFSATKSKVGVSSLNTRERQWAVGQATLSILGWFEPYVLTNFLNVSEACPFLTSAISPRSILPIPSENKCVF